MTKIKYHLGDIVMIPVRDTLFCFGRLLQDSSIGIYSFLSENIIDVNQLVEQKILFDPGVFDTNIVNGKWKIIGKIPFNYPNESWPSPKCIKDIINPNKYRIYYKGEMKSAMKQEVVLLEIQVMYKPEELIKEVINRLEV